jgi:hypothetical protein
MVESLDNANGLGFLETDMKVAGLWPLLLDLINDKVPEIRVQALSTSGIAIQNNPPSQTMVYRSFLQS